MTVGLRATAPPASWDGVNSTSLPLSEFATQRSPDASKPRPRGEGEVCALAELIVTAGTGWPLDVICVVLYSTTWLLM